MSTLRRLAFLTLCCGAATFVVTTYIVSLQNTVPAYLALPGPGYRVASPFHIYSGGKFVLSVAVPMRRPFDSSAITLLPESPIKCDLLADIRGPGGLKHTSSIKALTYEGSAEGCNLNHYEYGSFNLPRRGDYVLEIANQGPSALDARGALISIERSYTGDPSSHAVGIVFLHLLGWLLLACGLCLSILCEAISFARSAKSQRQA
jgi:hypothetical protein